MFNRILLLALCAGMLTSCIATALVGGTTTAAGMASDERAIGQHVDDVAIASKIDALLIGEKDMPSRWVSVEVIESSVWLTGYLPSQQHVDRAIHICRTVKGVRDVKSELHIGEPSIGSLFSDSLITTKVKRALLDDKIVSGFSIHVETVNGKVYLQGIVKNSEQRYRAKDITRNTSGVTAIVDLLQIRN